ncbi:SDR family NAD(P)-dependent oxidoreductase [Candidatus Parcubacteria bacterium]|jgi:UDP-glucuronate 4-epimerase|nr:SDR family NAD(P)-dependent oxidoreductase [Candidatus Parcubacteria bacterium]MBT7228757.1 SDR family NAD(P)-dependent oxidoreductase [Candidatus Parcubacteria bacterium]
MDRLKNKTILVTGSAGFIGFNVSKKLLAEGIKVVGIDNFNDYYSVELKEARNKLLEKFDNYKLYRGNLENIDFIEKVFEQEKIDRICHLAAQAGVRYSLEHPDVYIQTNIVATHNLLKLAKDHKVSDFVFASSSSVYGTIDVFPSKEDFNLQTPLSLYAATKQSGELMAHAYNHLYGLRIRCLRFFNVYGPWGRPDSALYIFTDLISKNKTIDVFGDSAKDYTYIDDIVDGVVNSIAVDLDYEIINLGNDRPIELSRYIELIEKELGKKATKNKLPPAVGDVQKSCADISKAKKLLGYNPKTPVEQGIKKFVAWYKEYYKIK